MRASEADILVIPGLGGSGPDHWQTRWEAKLSTARRVEQEDWDHPNLEIWQGRIIEAVEASSRPVVLVAHSLGVLAVAHAAPILRGKVKGGFLVAPPSMKSLADEVEAVDPAFSGAVGALSFPAVLVASRDDPFAPYCESEALAQALGAELADAGYSGHINIESGHGPWPEGLMRFAAFLTML
jgi:predicted alpha/beta hydrolase family esterase